MLGDLACQLVMNADLAAGDGIGIGIHDSSILSLFQTTLLAAFLPADV
jgi:hypothetical protein